jgi:hypothetical protein
MALIFACGCVGAGTGRVVCWIAGIFGLRTLIGVTSILAGIGVVSIIPYSSLVNDLRDHWDYPA